MLPSRRYEELRAPQLIEEMERVPLVYLPIGSLEYHGWHLQVGFDAMHAHELCLAAAEKTGGVVLPPTFWGTRGHEGFAGSLLLPESTIAWLVNDIINELISRGYRLIVLLTGHYPEAQGAVLQRVAQEARGVHPDVAFVVPDIFEGHPVYPGIEHAGRKETSVGLARWPELVDMDQLANPEALQAISQDAPEASAEFGREFFDTLVEHLVKMVETELEQL